jgi:hypothetical protein
MNVLMLGGANTGKSTFLVQLYGRMAARMGRLVTRSAPADLRPISDGLQRLASGIPLEHTRTSADHLMQHLPAATKDGRSVDFNIPEYAGETLDDLVRSHRIPEHWRPLIAESDQWLLFVRLEQFGQLPVLLSRPVKEPEAVLSSAALSPHEEAAVAGASRHSAAASDGDTELPLDMRLVELLQMLLHERGARPRGGVSKPFLSVLLSCWDELGLPDQSSPASAAEERIPLLYSYVRSAWREDAVEFLGLSSQGRSLTTDTPDEDFVDVGPEHHGYVVTGADDRDPDLTRILRAL